MSLTPLEEQQLIRLLEKRLAIIGDVTLREQNPTAHLEALKNISGEIDRFCMEFNPSLPPRLRHYLENASYQKALGWLANKDMPHMP